MLGRHLIVIKDFSNLFKGYSDNQKAVAVIDSHCQENWKTKRSNTFSQEREENKIAEIKSCSAAQSIFYNISIFLKGRLFFYLWNTKRKRERDLLSKLGFLCAYISLWSFGFFYTVRSLLQCVTDQTEIHDNKTRSTVALVAERLRQEVNPVGFEIMRRNG